MSMTVHMAVRGVTDLEVLIKALEEMGAKVSKAGNWGRRRSSRNVLVFAKIHGQRIGFGRGSEGELEMVGDQEWPIMSDREFQDRLQQQCSVVTVKKKVAELRYELASVTQLEDGSVRLVARAWG